MRKKNLWWYFRPVILIMTSSVVSVFSEIDLSSIKLTGLGAFEFGEIVNGQYSFAKYPAQKLDHYWMQKAIVRIGVESHDKNGVGVVLAGEGSVNFPYTLPSDGAGFGYEMLCPRFKWYIHHAEGSYSLGDIPEAPLLKIGVGFFPFKYNPDARNFGDYLLRINSYPQYLVTHFDGASTNLLGLRIENTISADSWLVLRNHLMLTSELYIWPLRDFSLSDLVSLSLFEFVDIGAGIMWHRLFSVNEKITTPPSEAQQGHKLTFAATKLMAQVAFDFKRFLPFKTVFGENDLRLYSELCVNGVKNYKEPDSIGGMENPLAPGYSDIKKRIPIAFGFNFPAFKILDVLSIEAEWWLNDYANSYWGVYPNGGGYEQNPFPWKYDSKDSRADPYGGQWHWSVYAKKTVLDKLTFTLQFARDHTILETTLTGTSNGDPEEAMDGKGNWGWMAKVAYGF